MACRLVCQLVHLVVSVSAHTMLWAYQEGEISLEDSAYAVAVDPVTKDVVLGGYTLGNVGGSLTGTRDWLAMKLGQDGVLQWAYQVGEAGGASEIHGVAIDGSGNVVLAGVRRGGQADIVVEMLNTAGVLQWSWQPFPTADDGATCVAVDSSNNIVVGGYTQGTIGGETFQGGSHDAVLLKLNSAGVQQWLMATALGTNRKDFIHGLTTDASDNILVIGEVGAAFDGNTAYGDQDVFILKTNGAGTFQWSYQTGTTADDIGTGVGISLSGDVYGAGYTKGSFPSYSNVGALDDIFILKLNAVGVQQWLIQVGSAAEDRTYGLAVHPSSGHVSVFGSTTGDLTGNTNAGGEDWWAAEYDASGLMQWNYFVGTALNGEVLYAGSYDENDLIIAGVIMFTASFQGNFVAMKFARPTSTTSSISTSSSSITSTSSSITSTTTGSSTSTSVTSSSSTWSITSSSRSVTTTSSSWSLTTTSSSWSSTTSSSRSTTSTTKSWTSTTASTTSSATSSATPSTTSSTTSTASTVPEGASTETSTTSTTLRLTRRQIAALDLQRQDDAAATVAELQAAEAKAVLEVLAAQRAENLSVTVLTDLGSSVVPLGVAGGTAAAVVGIEGANASVEVATSTVEEILAFLGEGPLLLSVMALHQNRTNKLKTDAIIGEASTLVSIPLSIKLWSSDGSRIEVKDLANPLQFSLEVTDPDVKCAFWDEDVAKWSTDGVTTIALTNGILQCSTRHLTIFAGIKDVFLSNVALALTCSTFSGLLTRSAFANLQRTAWLWSTPSILNLVFHVLGLVFILVAWLYDRKQERVIPWEEREEILMQVKDEHTEHEHEDGDALPPSRCTRCMACCTHSLEYVGHATGGDATVEALKEMAGNADTAAVNRAISTLQSHKARVARAQIAIFNKLQTKETVELERWQCNGPQRSAASQVFENTSDHGQAAARAFLQRGWLCRVATLWPASHPWLKAMHFSMQSPFRASVALLVLKITSSGALGAVFFSSSSPIPDSDPECVPPTSGVARAIQSLTVGLITALLSDVLVFILFAMQVKRVVFSKTEWTEKKKRRQRLHWNMWSFAFWLIVLLYGSFCELYLCLFLANVTEADRASWLQSMGVTLLQDLVLKSFLTAFAIATIATLVLCCRPHVIQKIHAKWIKDDTSQLTNQPEMPTKSKKVDLETPAIEHFDLQNLEDNRGQIFSVNLDSGIEKSETPEIPWPDVSDTLSDTDMLSETV